MGKQVGLGKGAATASKLCTLAANACHPQVTLGIVQLIICSQRCFAYLAAIFSLHFQMR